MKLCKDCAHYKLWVNVSMKQSDFVIPGHCMHPNNASLVDGTPRHTPEHLRYNEASTACRPEGYWWQERHDAAKGSEEK